MTGKTIRILLTDCEPTGILLSHAVRPDWYCSLEHIESGEAVVKFQGALVKEQGVTFAVVIVRKRVLTSSAERDKVRASFAPLFGGVPTILMAQDSRGVPTYQGRKDIVNFLASVPMESIPWQEYTVN